MLPGLHPVADRLRDHLVRTAPALTWRCEQVAFPDYDLIVGPSGTLLALSTGTRPTPAQLGPYADHLARLCDADELPRLRTGQYAATRTWAGSTDGSTPARATAPQESSPHSPQPYATSDRTPT